MSYLETGPVSRPGARQRETGSACVGLGPSAPLPCPADVQLPLEPSSSRCLYSLEHKHLPTDWIQAQRLILGNGQKKHFILRSEISKHVSD